ncbi:uncharacterized protein [Montipora capricornis]|uniref:uncharacterized protein isoform X2 n=1 Tax=Montipora capricornis TaxID=246305 RepID=UPI0035F14E7B
MNFASLFVVFSFPSLDDQPTSVFLLKTFSIGTLQESFLVVEDLPSISIHFDGFSIPAQKVLKRNIARSLVLQTVNDPQREWCRIVFECADALYYTHSKEYLHNDL